jgi:hypothetical protein
MAYEDVIAGRCWAMPEGWKELKGAMTAPNGWMWAYNGKSVFQSGRKIGLVKCRKRKVQPNSEDCDDGQCEPHPVSVKKKEQKKEVDKDCRRVMQILARKKMIHKLLSDISMDMRISQLEGWDCMEYPRELAEMLAGIVKGHIKYEEHMA